MMMEWECEWQWQGQEQNHPEELLQQQIDDQQNPNGVAGFYVKVMTDEQMELLRRQISVYATICEQLAEMHKAITAHQDPSGVGMRVGNLYSDSLMVCGGHKMSARQRWTPTPLQLQILEQIFDEGIGTPSKLKIKEMTTELAQHGQISETNVYNWFQNRRARSKKKQSIPPPDNVELEAQTQAQVESVKEKDRSESENIQPHENVYFLRPEIDDTEFLDKGEPMFPSDSAIFHQFGSFEPYAKAMM